MEKGAPCIICVGTPDITELRRVVNNEEVIDLVMIDLKTTSENPLEKKIPLKLHAIDTSDYTFYDDKKKARRASQRTNPFKYT